MSVRDRGDICIYRIYVKCKVHIVDNAGRVLVYV